jgi:hypothetical protein
MIIYYYSFQTKKGRGGGGEDNILQYAHILTLLRKIMHIKNELPEEILFHNIFCYSSKIIAKIPTTFTNNIYIYIYEKVKAFQFQNTI